MNGGKDYAAIGLIAWSTFASMKLLGIIIGTKESSLSIASSRFFPTSCPLAREALVRDNGCVPFCAILEEDDFLKY